MKKLALSLCLFLGLLIHLNAQTYSNYIATADSLYKEKSYQASGETFEKAFAIEKEPKASHLYNAACSWALAGNVKKGLERLDQSVDAGWMNLDWMQKDADLNTLHEEKGWKLIVTKLEKKIEAYEATLNKPLMDELAQIGTDDQLYRRQMRDVQKEFGWDSPQMKELWTKQSALDSQNLLRIKEIIEEHGYPGKTLVGHRRSVAFLVIQHSDHETQEEYLPILKAAADKGELSWSSLALLIDRVRLGNDEPQLYGSQIRFNKETEKHELFPIEDEPNVNNRRAKVGLGPLEDYVKRWDIDYRVPSK